APAERRAHVDEVSRVAEALALAREDELRAARQPGAAHPLAPGAASPHGSGPPGPDLACRAPARAARPGRGARADRGHPPGPRGGVTAGPAPLGRCPVRISRRDSP